MIVILDNLRSALNVGSIIRSSDAFGIKEIYFCGITPSIKHKKVLKTSLGAEKHILAYDMQTTENAIAKLRNNGYQIIGLEISDNSIELSDAKTADKFALIVGNEVSGLSGEIQKLCDLLIAIPMKGIKESLNVAVAFGIAAYKLTNQ